MSAPTGMHSEHGDFDVNWRSGSAAGIKSDGNCGTPTTLHVTAAAALVVTLLVLAWPLRICFEQRAVACLGGMWVGGGVLAAACIIGVGDFLSYRCRTTELWVGWGGMCQVATIKNVELVTTILG